MSDSTLSLRRSISGAVDLQSVVRTMKAVAASSVGQYERAVLALTDYAQSVELGLGACVRAAAPTTPEPPAAREVEAIGAIVFGSDQGLVAQFNDLIVRHAIDTLASQKTLAAPPTVKYWAVGERVQAHLTDDGLPLLGCFELPGSVQTIAPLVGKILADCEAHRARGDCGPVWVFHHRPRSGAVFEPVGHRLLPLDPGWQRRRAASRWPPGALPEVVGDAARTLRGFVREFLFISLYRACAESLASENASRLAAMERADKNIDEMLRDLQGSFHRVRQNRIDEELFDLTAGFNALS